MHLTNQFRPAFRFPSLHVAGQMNKMLWLWKLAQEDDKHCACRDLCPDVARNYFRCNYNGHILRNGSTDSGRQQRQRHMACGDRQDDVSRRANPLANWYLLLLKCPKLVDTFHLVFQTLIHPASHSKWNAPKMEESPPAQEEQQPIGDRRSIIRRRIRRLARRSRAGTYIHMFRIGFFWGMVDGGWEMGDGHGIWRSTLSILRLISVGTRLWHGLVSSRQLS